MGLGGERGGAAKVLRPECLFARRGGLFVIITAGSSPAHCTFIHSCPLMRPLNSRCSPIPTCFIHLTFPHSSHPRCDPSTTSYPSHAEFGVERAGPGLNYSVINLHVLAYTADGTGAAPRHSGIQMPDSSFLLRAA